VSQDNATITSKISSFLAKFNEVTDYLKGKTSTDTTTYTRGRLAGDFIYLNLRRQLMSEVFSQVSGLAAGDPDRLSEIGITFDDEMHATISDSTALNNALNDDAGAVAALFNSTDGVAARIVERLTPFTQTSGIIDDTKTSISSQVKTIDDRIARLNDLLEVREAEYRRQFTALQETLNAITEQQSYLQSLLTIFGVSTTYTTTV